MIFALRVVIIAAAVFFLVGGLHPSLANLSASLITAGVLTWTAARSRASGGDLLVVLAGLYFILTSLAAIPETVLFGYVPMQAAPLFMAEQLAIALIIAVLATVLFGKTKATAYTTPSFSLPALAWRVGAGVAVFVAGYLIAGMIIYPFVQSYWAGKPMPPIAATLGMQVLRAVALLAAAGLVARTMASRREAAVLLAVAFPALGVFCLRFPVSVGSGMPAQ